jgi:hypothetical protein
MDYVSRQGRRRTPARSVADALVIPLRYALKTASDPSGMLERESAELGLSPHLRSLLQQHLPTKVESVTADSLIA